MKSIFIDNKLDNIFLDYYNFLINNEIDSYESIDYVFNIIDSLKIPLDYLKYVCFKSNIKSNGMYIQDEKKIIINPYKIIGCYKLEYFDKSKTILSYFNLLIHEINHTYQCFYRDNINDDVSNVLKESLKLRFLSNNDYDLYPLFPDEVNSNINSSLYLYKFVRNNNLGNLDFVEKSLIYFLSLGIINEDKIINSQIKYLYKEIMNIDFNDKFNSLDNVDSIYLGLTKNESTMKQLIKSYQTQKLCLDINFRKEI